MRLLDRMYMTSPVVRRASRWGRQVPRAIRRMNLQDGAFADSPPILANSVPKSGTHLLTQILMTMAERDYGTFWLSVPSRPYRERSEATMLRALTRLVPGELVSAHLFFEPAFHAELQRRNVAHVFVYRDPRDIVVSEADYLTRVNTWHGMHARFRALGSAEERVSLAIEGCTEGGRPAYPNVAERYRRYLGWLRQDQVLAVRFEDLIGHRRLETVREVVRFVARRAGRPDDEDAWVSAALAGIDPGRSFTFRQGLAGGWRKAFTEVHREQMKAVAGDLLIELGYEEDVSW